MALDERELDVEALLGTQTRVVLFVRAVGILETSEDLSDPLHGSKLITALPFGLWCDIPSSTVFSAPTSLTLPAE